MQGIVYSPGFPTIKPSFDYMYSHNQKMNYTRDICAELWKDKYCLSQAVLKGFTLLHNERTSNTAWNKAQLDNLDRLYDIERLKKDWNGNGAKPISKEVISRSREIIINIIEQPKVFPTGRATIHMEFELSDKSYLEFEIFEDKIVSMVVPQRVYEKTKVEVMENLNISLINSIVGDFYGRKNTKDRNALQSH